MGNCRICDGDDRMPYTCNHCGGQYCSEHRLPEAHDCGGGANIKRTDRQKRKHPHPSQSDTGKTNSASSSVLINLFSPVLASIYFLFAVLRILFSFTGLKVILVLGAFLFALSATAGLGVPEIDEPVNRTASSFANSANESTTPEPLNQSKVERQIHYNINQERQERGLSPLRHDTSLRKIARGHSSDMAQQGYFSHTSPAGMDFEDRYNEAGYNCRVYTSGNMYYDGGENIAYTYADTEVQADNGRSVDHNRNETSIARGLVNQWMNSSGHRENILRPFWDNEGIGIATVRDDEGYLRVYATQNFC